MELLVVIAIIGILSSIVIASMTSARQKARDTKRISDIKQLQLALAFFADANSNHYPSALTSCSDTTTCLAPTYIPAIPTPPTGGSYTYVALAAVVDTSPCISYHLGAVLETNSSVLQDDNDASAGTRCGSANDFSGMAGANDGSGIDACGTGTTGYCFDVKP